MIDMPVTSPPGDPLASRSGARVFAALADAGGAAPIDALADRSGLHPNSVRLHLRRLERGGLVTVTNEHRPGRGRPRQLWRIVPGAEPAGSPPVAYSELAGWLSTALTPAAAVEHGRRIGADRGREAISAPAADVLERSLTAMGFLPTRRDRGARTCFTLHNCPYRDVARANQRVVCALHRGIAEGMCKAADPGYALVGFEVRDPEEAGCAIEIDRVEDNDKETSR